MQVTFYKVFQLVFCVTDINSNVMIKLMLLRIVSKKEVILNNVHVRKID